MGERDDRLDPRSVTPDRVGEAAGGVTGALTGAALGSAGGPVGTMIGAVAGAIGGWWAGRALSEAGARVTEDDDAVFRDEFERGANRPPDWDYERVRPAYHLGLLASMNPDYVDRRFEDIEPELERGWNAVARDRYGDWADYRSYAERGYASGGPQLVETEALGDGTAATGYAMGLDDATTDAVAASGDADAIDATDATLAGETDPHSVPGVGPADSAATFIERTVTSHVEYDADQRRGESGRGASSVLPPKPDRETNA